MYMYAKLPQYYYISCVRPEASRLSTTKSPHVVEYGIKMKFVPWFLSQVILF